MKTKWLNNANIMKGNKNDFLVEGEIVNCVKALT